MSRRKIHHEEEFGSDSFLDVVANIVGILIILIVVAGIKAGAAPITAEHVATFLRSHDSAPLKPATRPEPIVIPPSPKLVRQAEALKDELTALDSGAKDTVGDINQKKLSQEKVDRQIAELKAVLETELANLTDEERRAAEAQSRLGQQKTGLMQLEVDVQSLQAKKAPVKTLKHQLTPLSREIQGKELHFRLLKDRVAYLPIEELMQRLRPEITRRRQRLLREGIQRGEVGPVAGFSMSYVIEVQQLSAMDELRRGMSMSVGVSEWRLIPEPDLDTESGEEALKDGSAFLRVLREADPQTTITFWVYPDSFKIYRALQEFAHKENFTVAARPLPFDVPIAGSPHGSRSSGQ